MKNVKSFLFTALFFLFISDALCQLNINAVFGSSITKGGLNPSFGFFFQNQVGKNISFEAGLYHSSFEQPASNNLLTYDWRNYTAFFGGAYTFKLSDKMQINPFIDYGYGYFVYSLNEFDYPSKDKGAWSLYPGVRVVVGLTEKFSLVLKNRFVIHFIEFEIPEDSTIPDNMITVPKKQQELFDICFGFKYHLK